MKIIDPLYRLRAFHLASQVCAKNDRKFWTKFGLKSYDHGVFSDGFGSSSEL